MATWISAPNATPRKALPVNVTQRYLRAKPKHQTGDGAGNGHPSRQPGPSLYDLPWKGKGIARGLWALLAGVSSPWPSYTKDLKLLGLRPRVSKTGVTPAPHDQRRRSPARRAEAKNPPESPGRLWPRKEEGSPKGPNHVSGPVRLGDAGAAPGFLNSTIFPCPLQGGMLWNFDFFTFLGRAPPTKSEGHLRAKLSQDCYGALGHTFSLVKRHVWGALTQIFPKRKICL